MSTYTVIPLEPPISPSQIAMYKRLRLSSLQIDPQAFSSTHAREVKFTDDIWQERIESHFKRTFVASASLDAPKYRVVDQDSSIQAGESGEWIGVAGIISPSEMPESTLAAFREAGVDTKWEIYGLFAMWVHPEHRRKSVGAQLVKACLEWARAHVDTKFWSGKSGQLEKVVVLLVYSDNIAGRALYSRMGFTDLEGVAAREGERWMLAKV